MDELARRAEQAKLVLENPLFQNSFSKIRERIYAEIEDIGIFTILSQRKREKLCFKLSLLRELEFEIDKEIKLSAMMNDRENT